MRLRTIQTAALAGILAAPTAFAAQFDGSRPLLCSAYRMFECDIEAGCVPVQPTEIGASSAWELDFRKMEMTGTAPGSAANAIDKMEVLDGKLFLTGVQDGLPVQRDGVAYSVAINDPDGFMSITVAGEHVAFVGLGNCAPR
ncbi:MAG: hypothetical protein V2J02_10620 [Pseudomonadales bacterium]|jgi:hypothetical protein|nr:hypothetical protein [Pseudomonadales bacterium]